MAEATHISGYSLFWDITQRRLVVSDVSGQYIAHTFKGQEVKVFLE
jgi:hypothetical protein